MVCTCALFDFIYLIINILHVFILCTFFALGRHFYFFFALKEKSNFVTSKQQQMKKVTTLKQLIDSAFSREVGLVKLELGKITKTQVAAIKKATGFNLENYMHVVDIYAIRHAIAQHGSTQQEASRGQIAVNIDDFALIPKIIANPDAIYYEGINKQGNPVLIYEKTIDNKIFYLEEIRAGRNEVAMQTMYKRKAPTTKVEDC